MNDSKTQFRVGLFVIFSMGVIGAMIFQFGDIKKYFEPKYELSIHFDKAPGVYAGTPVTQNGVAIGKVKLVEFNDKVGGVTVVIEIKEHIRLRSDSQPILSQSLLGDSKIDFQPGIAPNLIEPGKKLKGVASMDPMKIVQEMEQHLVRTLKSFDQTSQEWKKLGNNINQLVQTNEGNLNHVVEQSVVSLKQFTKTMEIVNETLINANNIVGDPINQKHLRETLSSMPRLVQETHTTIRTVKNAIQKAESSLDNIQHVTEPLAHHTVSIVTKLDNSLSSLESLSSNLDGFVQLATKQGGTIQKLVTEPTLYKNMNQSAESMSIMLKNLDPIMRDIRIFSDKIARHPELIGVGGALRGSSGLKEPTSQKPVRKISRRPRAIIRK
jgi:phospholipid/cholesterol/gamma-HCH transport system substrate-binding protein